MHVAVLRVVVCGLGVAGCAGGGGEAERAAADPVVLAAVRPAVLLPGSRIEIEGGPFAEEPAATSWLGLEGTFEGQPVAADLQATFDDLDRLHVTADRPTLARIGPTHGRFEGELRVVVDSHAAGERYVSPPLPHAFTLVSQLQPRVDRMLDAGAIYVNDSIEVEGDGLLLPPGEGTTYAVIDGCFAAAGSATCRDVAAVHSPVTPDAALGRARGTFPFSPAVVGIGPGHFEGTVVLRNEHADGAVTQSEAHPVAYAILPPAIQAVSEQASVGQYLEISGGGFVGGRAGEVTTLRLEGEIRGRADGDTIQVEPVTVFPKFAGGRRLLYALHEADALGQLLERADGLRRTDARFEGTVEAIVQYEGAVEEGDREALAFDIRPVKQVVWVKFEPSFVEGLRLFGLRAVDRAIRDRILAVLRRDYAGVNVEFREDEPTDFEVFAVVEIAGADPNGLGLLGYDNTHGKDVGNERLYDQIGGVNAQQQEDGHAGYGGVFVESIFAFSTHPPTGIEAKAPTALFDEIFDPFRPDLGLAVSSRDAAEGGIPVLDDGAVCPSSERRVAAACAVWALGSLIGSTTSHELGHSLGLADPDGARPHNLGDGVGRLMDEGAARPFDERAELLGAGPAVFCDRGYAYLREILPTDAPQPDVDRPAC